jgi:hypothetical protein
VQIISSYATYIESILHQRFKQPGISDHLFANLLALASHLYDTLAVAHKLRAIELGSFWVSGVVYNLWKLLDIVFILRTCLFL